MLVVFFLFVSTVFYQGICEKFYIITSPGSPCPGEIIGEACITLQQYVSTPSHSANVTLILQPGHHDLNSDLIAESADYFLVNSSNATVVCGTLKPKLQFTSINNVEIIGVTFSRCGDIVFNMLTAFNIVKSSFISCGYGKVNSVQDMQMNYVSIIGKNKLTLQKVDRSSFENCIIREMIKIYHGSSVNITRTKVFNIQAGTLRIQFVTYITVNESTFVNTGAVGGGAIYSVGNDFLVTVTNSNFSHSSAYGQGGAICIRGGSLMVTNTTFEFNRATGGRGFGGAVYVNGGSITIARCIFANNLANIDGGAIFCDDCHFISINDSRFISNRAIGNGGGVNAGSGLITISQSVFKNNTAQNGGAIQLLSGKLDLTASYFTNNTVSVQGGAIYMSGDSIQLNETSFINNTAILMSGGALYCAGNYANILLFESTFLNNSASYCGVMEIDDLHHKVNIIKCMFTDNIATGRTVGGGVACIRNASVYISNSTFRRNTAKLDAGCLHVEESTMTVESSSFIGNTAKFKGGVMSTNMYPTSYTITHSYFAHNEADNSGGVMYIGTKGSDVRILNETVLGYNHAGKKGGAISIVGSTLVISDTSIYNNSAHLGRIISACNSDITLQAYDKIVISRDPNTSFCTYYDEKSTFGDTLSSQPQLLYGATTTHHLYSHMTTDPIASSDTVKPTEGYQSNTRPAIDGVTNSHHLYSHIIATEPIVSSTTAKATEGYHSNTRPSILHGSDETPAITNTLSSMTVIVYVMTAMSSLVILLCLIVVVVKKIGKRDGKLTVKFVNKYTLNGLCIGHRYRPVVDLDDDHNIIELNSGHLLSTRDDVNSLSDSDEEL